MPIFNFTFVIDGASMDDVDQVDQISGRCDGLTLAEIGGVTLAVFEREAPSADHALADAAGELEAAGSTVQVLRLDQDLVAVPDIAERSGRSRQSVRMLADGDRGSGDFPDPVGIVGKGIRVWEWASIDQWLRRSAGSDDAVFQIDADTAARFNGKLSERRSAVAGVAATSGGL